MKNITNETHSITARVYGTEDGILVWGPHPFDPVGDNLEEAANEAVEYSNNFPGEILERFTVETVETGDPTLVRVSGRVRANDEEAVVTIDIEAVKR